MSELICGRNCFDCLYDDCIVDDVSSDEILEINERNLKPERARQREYDRRYLNSPKGNISRRKYNKSDKKKEADKRYRQSESGRLSTHRYNISEAKKEANRRYYQKKKMEREEVVKCS